MKPEQAKAILADAPEGATHFDIDNSEVLDWIKFDDSICGGEWSRWMRGGWQEIDGIQMDDFYSIHALSDLRQIVEQAERIEALEKCVCQDCGGSGYIGSPPDDFQDCPTCAAPFMRIEAIKSAIEHEINNTNNAPVLNALQRIEELLGE